MWCKTMQQCASDWQSYVFCDIVSDVYYGGEAVSLEQPQAFTCPYCGNLGFTEATLHDHVTAEHPDSSVEVVSSDVTEVVL